MKFLLLDNAIDSMEWSLKHLSCFLGMDLNYEHPENSATYLKQGILCLNHALELLLKYKLSEINPLLIFKCGANGNIHDDIICYLKKQRCGEIVIPIYDYMIENSHLQTIDYSKCIELYCAIYSVPVNYRASFINLNSIRNQLTHMGIETKEEYFRLAGDIGNLLYYSHFELLREMEYEKNRIENLCGEIVGVETALSEIEDAVWHKKNKEKIEIICNEVLEVFGNSTIKKYMKEKGIVADSGATFDAEFMYALFSMQYKQNMQEIAAIYAMCSKDALLLSDSDNRDGPVFAVFPIEQKNSRPNNFFLARNECGEIIDAFCAQGDFWNKEYKDRFEKVPFGKGKLMELSQKIINYMSEIKFVPFQ